MNIGFIGLGNIGTTLANLIALNGYNVLGWEYDKEVVDQINERHENLRFLKGIPLSDNLKATKKVQEVLYRSDILFNAIHSSRTFAPENRANKKVLGSVIY